MFSTSIEVLILQSLRGKVNPTCLNSPSDFSHEVTPRGPKPQPKKMEPQITQITQINKKLLEVQEGLAAAVFGLLSEFYCLSFFTND